MVRHICSEIIDFFFISYVFLLMNILFVALERNTMIIEWPVSYYPLSYEVIVAALEAGISDK